MSEAAVAKNEEDEETVFDAAGLAGESAAEEESERLTLPAIVCALLFVSTRPLDVPTLAEAARASAAEVEAALEQLKGVFDERQHGIVLVEAGGGFQLRTAARASRYIHRLIPPRAKKLSRAAAETLAVIAYKQPVQRAEIEAIRGVDALPTLKTLLEARLIRIVGRADSAGHPALYGTTQTFLEKFGLRDLSELPTVRELKELAEDPGESEDSDEDVLSDQAAGAASEQEETF